MFKIIEKRSNTIVEKKKETTKKRFNLIQALLLSHLFNLLLIKTVSIEILKENEIQLNTK
jgi:hypothetical protein